MPTFTGLRRGLIKAALSLGELVVGAILAGRYYSLLAGRLAFIQQDSLANAAAFGFVLGAAFSGALLTLWVNFLGGA